MTEFILFLMELTRSYGTVAGIYGHLGDGNTHFRPVLNPMDPDDPEQIRALRKAVDDAGLDRFRGPPSGEHGIGRIRADALARMWGPEVYGAMRATGDALDPRGILDPSVMFSFLER